MKNNQEFLEYIRKAGLKGRKVREGTEKLSGKEEKWKIAAKKCSDA